MSAARRWTLVGLLCLAGGVVNQGCLVLGATQTVGAFDLCSVLNCQGSVFGFRLCGSPNTATDDVLADCRNFVTEETP
jgi:hypothetical protein